MHKLLILLILLIPGYVSAQQSVLVYNSRGGSIDLRVQQLTQIIKNNTSVKILGDRCYSTCTMFLGAPSVCVMPNTDFRFHGPRHRNGSRLEPKLFEHYSQLMAQFYREPLKTWFLGTARYMHYSYYSLTGKQLIDLGYKQC